VLTVGLLHTDVMVRIRAKNVEVHFVMLGFESFFYFRKPHSDLSALMDSLGSWIGQLVYFSNLRSEFVVFGDVSACPPLNCTYGRLIGG
jgi:hypothetical protein